MKNPYILSLKGFFFTLTLLKRMKKSINNPSGLILLITNMKIIAKQFWSIKNLAKAQVFILIN